MQKALKYSKIIAWFGIILNSILLCILFILYNAYFDASWILTALNILSPIAIIAEIMMIGGIAAKAFFEYKLGGRGIRPSKKDLVIILAAVVIAVIYSIIKFFFFR